MTVMVIAPHPDDETLGCGATLLRHKAMGDSVHWVIATDMKNGVGYSLGAIEKRRREISEVSKAYEFSSTVELGFSTTMLDQVPMAQLVSKMSEVFKGVNPTVVYLPFSGDSHSDHGMVAGAVLSCAKWFRHSSVQKIYAYEVLSETDFALDPSRSKFEPSVFVNVTKYFQKKIEIAQIYSSEMGQFPFPRSVEALKALANVRGAASGCEYAEAFMLIKEIITE